MKILVRGGRDESSGGVLQGEDLFVGSFDLI